MSDSKASASDSKAAAAASEAKASSAEPVEDVGAEGDEGDADDDAGMPMFVQKDEVVATIELDGALRVCLKRALVDRSLIL